VRRIPGPRLLVLSAVAGLLAAAPFAVPAVAQTAENWIATLKWPDGKEVQWKATSAPGCDGSNVDVRLVNNSASTGTARLNSITFSCKRGSEYVSSERVLGVVMPGTTVSAPALMCACAEQGGVKDMLSADLAFQREGQGADVSANGCSYTGSFSGGKRGGRGVYSCPTGYKYDGFWLADVQTGQGTETLPTGEKYTGDFVAGKRQGRGEMTYADGSTYFGDFRNGLRDGVGNGKYKDGSEYQGDWKNDKRNGEGSYTGAGGQWTYTGGWSGDLRNGAGKLIYTDGSYTYEGPFRNDLREGQGSATFGDGRTFKGTFVHGEQIGPGTMTFSDGRKVVGDFRDHLPDGKAVETGGPATFDGEWKAGVLDGKATVTYPNGVRFDGLFAGGKRNGLGYEILSDGLSKEECMWVNDTAQQPCTRIDKNGKRSVIKPPKQPKKAPPIEFRN